MARLYKGGSDGKMIQSSSRLEMRLNDDTEDSATRLNEMSELSILASEDWQVIHALHLNVSNTNHLSHSTKYSSWLTRRIWRLATLRNDEVVSVFRDDCCLEFRLRPVVPGHEFLLYPFIFLTWSYKRVTTYGIWTLSQILCPHLTLSLDPQPLSSLKRELP